MIQIKSLPSHLIFSLRFSQSTLCNLSDHKIVKLSANQISSDVQVDLWHQVVKNVTKRHPLNFCQLGHDAYNQRRICDSRSYNDHWFLRILKHLLAMCLNHKMYDYVIVVTSDRFSIEFLHSIVQKCLDTALVFACSMLNHLIPNHWHGYLCH